MAFTQTAHSLDPAKPAANLMSVRPNSEVAKRTVVPITRAMLTRSFEPVIAYQGGAYGDDVSTATATIAYGTNTAEAGAAENPAYGPKTQTEKAAQLGTTLAQDVTSPRGWVDPSEPYGPAPVSPTDDPTIASLTPATGVSGGSPIWVRITGTKFTPFSQVETGNVYTPYSRYFNATRIDVLMDPRSSPGVVVVKVIDHGVKSNGSNFTFT